jgi:hypothetical protein
MDRFATRGMALALVLCVLTVVTALLAAAVAIARVELRAAGNRRRLDLALGQAEVSLVESVSRWTPATLSRGLPALFDSLSFPDPPPLPGTVVARRSGVLRRLGRGLFLMEVTAVGSEEGAGDGIVAHVGWLLGVRPVSVQPRAALTTHGPVILEAGASVDGRDAAPAAFECDPESDSTRAGIATDGPARALPGSSLSGDPPALRVGPPEDSAQSAVQAGWFAELASQAVVGIPGGGAWTTRPVSVDGRCDVSVASNWGGSDGGSVCATYFPVVHVAGDLSLVDGQGQGILLVDGDLDVRGDYTFWGLVMVRGRLRTVGDPHILRVWGAVVSGGVAEEGRPVSGFVVQYSKCLLSLALQSSGRLVPLSSRAWKQLF